MAMYSLDRRPYGSKNDAQRANFNPHPKAIVPVSVVGWGYREPTHELKHVRCMERAPGMLREQR